MAEKKEKPLTRDDVRKRIRHNDSKAAGLDFSLQQFEEGINLSGLDLSGINLNYTRLFRANFNGSNLDRAVMQKAYLGYATFNPLESKAASLEGVDLRSANLHDVEFREANLVGAQFQETELEGVVHPPQLQGRVLALLPASLERTDFSYANLFRANFKGCFLYGTKFEGASIRGADIYDAHLEDADWGNYKIGDEEKKDFYSAEIIYRRLKQWYTNAGMSDVAAIFYFREREAIRKALKWRSRYWHHRLAMQGSYLAFGHGERWRRIFLWMALVVLGSAVAYYLRGGLDPLYSLYFSVISFTALGYGKWVDIVPQGWVQALGAFQSFTGVFLMALLLVTFFRKWTR